MYKVLCVLILLIILLRPALVIYNKRAIFFPKTYYWNIYPHLHKLYYSSQYVQKKNPGIMPDHTFESFAAGIFLKGLNPILITHDQPPLGRYIFSLSILIFDNVNTITIFLILLSTVGVFLIGRLVLGNTLIALIPFGIFINEPLLLSKFTYSPLLEPAQLPFIIFALYFFILGILQKKNYAKWFIFTSIMIGFVISIRFFVLGLFMLIAMISYFLLQILLQRKMDNRLIFFILSLPVSLIVLILSYIKTIESGYSIVQIFGIQKYILFYHKSKFILPFSFWDLLLFNRWHTWWGTMSISYDPEWIIMWPLTTILSGAYLALVWLKKIGLSASEKVLFLWVIMYMLMLSLGYTSTRYFLPLTPFLYILSVSFVIKFIKLFLLNRRNKRN